VFLIACKVIGPSLRDILPPLVLTTVQAVLTGYITQVVVKMVHSSVSSQHHVPGIAVSTICIAVGTAVAMVVYVALSYVLQRRLSRRIMALVRR
jgi:predicted anti-sigma-YlaC factor YlaD